MQDIREIGVVRNDVTEPMDPFELRKKESIIEVHKDYEDGLYRIEESQYLQIVFYFHRSREYRLRGPTYSGDVRGVFASRSPHRPSALGVTTVKLVERQGRMLRVQGLDAIDGTPVLDIKPYAPLLDEEEQQSAAREYRRAHPRFEVMRLIRTSEMEKLLLRAGELHGHFCPGLALGVMAGAYAVQQMGWSSHGMEKVVAIVESNNCFADGVQYVTGCTFGNNALIFRDYGKTAFTLADRTGEGIRIAARPGERWSDDQFAPLFEKVVKERAGGTEEEARFRQMAGRQAFQLLEKNMEDLFIIEQVTVDVPDYAPIHDSVTCDICHQPVMATRMVEMGDRHLCLSCARAPYYELTGAGIARKKGP